MKDKIVFWTHAYNSENTVARTIESVLSQTYEDFEYVILDNGSKDKTGEIIKSYAEKDSRIKPLFIKENKLCMSYAYMPLLLKEANGGYLAWIDADDEYDKTFLEKMYSFVKQNGLSAACCGTVYCRPNGEFKPDKPVKTAVLEGRDFADSISLYYKYVTRLWCNLYSAKLLSQDMFPSKPYQGSTFFDAMIPLNIYKKAERAGTLSESLHKYHLHPGQLSCRYTPKFYWWICKVTDHLREYLESYGPLSESAENFIWQRFFVWLVYAVRSLKCSEADSATKINDITAMLEGERTKILFSRDWKTLGILTAKKDFLLDLKDFADKQGTVAGCELAANKLIKIISEYSEENRCPDV